MTSNISTYTKPIFIIIFTISIMLNMLLLSHKTILHIIGSIGGGESKESPDGSMKAIAHSAKQLLSDEPTYYEFIVEYGEERKYYHVINNEYRGYDYFERLSQIIYWSDDSKNVKFVIPGFQLKLDVDNMKREE
jgi:hypothetical protein